jgi:hypothetical protein
LTEDGSRLAKARQEFAGFCGLHPSAAHEQTIACRGFPKGRGLRATEGGIQLKAPIVFLAMMIFAACVSSRQIRTRAENVQAAVPVLSEPDHHLAIHNQYVNVFRVEVAPHKATLLHQHDHDYVYITLGDADVTSVTPGKPDAHLQLLDGAVRYSRGGFAHVARNNGDAPFRNDTIELLLPQGELRNLCMRVIPDQPANCPPPPVQAMDVTPVVRPEFETDETRVLFTRILPHQQMALRDPEHELLLVAVDDVVLAPAAGKGLERLLRPGDPVWLGRAEVAHVLKNDSDKGARYVTLVIKPHDSDRAAPGAAHGPITGPPLQPHHPAQAGNGKPPAIK